VPSIFEFKLKDTGAIVKFYQGWNNLHG
jgi:hypothetical protein